MESASDVRWKCENALSGTALLIAELLVVFAEELVPDPVELLLGDNAFEGAVSAPEEGV